MYRHGDVLILDAAPLPNEATRRDTDVVAEGEATGHAHRLTGGEVWSMANGLAITAGDNAKLTHEEHKTLSLSPTADGMCYPIIIQREYDDAHEWRQVAD